MTREQIKKAVIELTEQLSLEDLKEIIEILEKKYNSRLVFPDHNS